MKRLIIHGTVWKGYIINGKTLERFVMYSNPRSSTQIYVESFLRLKFTLFGYVQPNPSTQAQSMHWKMNPRTQFILILVSMVFHLNKISNLMKLWEIWKSLQETIVDIKDCMLKRSWQKKSLRRCLTDHITRKSGKVFHCVRRLFPKSMIRLADLDVNKVTKLFGYFSGNITLKITQPKIVFYSFL